MAKNNSREGARSSRLPRGMIDTSNLDSIGANIHAIMDKKLFKLNLGQGSFNISTANEAKSFSCRINGGTNHDTSYCGGLNYEHLASIDYGAGILKGTQL